MAWIFGLLLVGTMLMLGGGYAYGNATMVVMEELNPAVAAAVQRQRRFYAGCIGLGVLLLCTGIWAFAVEGAEAGWPVLAGAGAFAATGAAAAARCGCWADTRCPLLWPVCASLCHLQ